MQLKIPFNFICLVLLSIIFIFEETQCASVKQNRDNRFQIAQQDRAACLEKLICGINLVGTKSAVNGYTEQVDLITRYFKLYP